MFACALQYGYIITLLPLLLPYLPQVNLKAKSHPHASSDAIISYRNYHYHTKTTMCNTSKTKITQAKIKLAHVHHYLASTRAG
jgi:hypothetical protein